MGRAIFEAELRAQGYQEIREGEMFANKINPEHSHEFDARVLVLGGEIAITSGGEERTYRTGDVFAVSAGTTHAERCGPNGLHYFAGHRHPQKPAI